MNQGKSLIGTTPLDDAAKKDYRMSQSFRNVVLYRLKQFNIVTGVNLALKGKSRAIWKQCYLVLASKSSQNSSTWDVIGISDSSPHSSFSVIAESVSEYFSRFCGLGILV